MLSLNIKKIIVFPWLYIHVCQSAKKDYYCNVTFTFKYLRITAWDDVYEMFNSTSALSSSAIRMFTRGGIASVEITEMTKIEINKWWQKYKYIYIITVTS